MTTVFLCGVIVTAVVGVVMLRPRGRKRSAISGPAQQFPWFWVAFPATVLCVLSAAGVLLSWFGTVGDDVDPVVDWSLTYPEFSRSGVVQYLSNEQFEALWGPLCPHVYLWFWPVAAVVGIAACVIAWRRGMH